MKQPKIVLLIFVSGKIVLTGAKSLDWCQLKEVVAEKTGKLDAAGVRYSSQICLAATGLDVGCAFFAGNNSINNIFMPRNIRRGMWNFFRLENEHLNNVERYRAFKSVPLPFTYYNDEEEDDDDIDKAE